MSSTIERDALLAAASEALQRRVSPTVLKRFVMAGLVQRPVQDHPGGRRGSVSRYPVEALDQFIAVLRLQQRCRPFVDLRVHAFWDDLWVDPVALRRSFRALLDPASDEIRREIALHGDAEEAALAIGEQFPECGHTPSTALMRRRVRSDADLTTVAHVMARLALNLPAVWEVADVGLDEAELSPAELVEQAMGVKKAANETLLGQPLLDGPINTPAVLEELQALGMFDLSDLARALVDASDEELRAAREQARILERLSEFFGDVERVVGRDRAGIGSFRLMSRQTAITRVMLLRHAVIAPMAESDVAEWADALSDGAATAEAMARLWRQLPQYRHLLGADVSALIDALPDEVREELYAAARAVVEDT